MEYYFVKEDLCSYDKNEILFCMIKQLCDKYPIFIDQNSYKNTEYISIKSPKGNEMTKIYTFGKDIPFEQLMKLLYSQYDFYLKYAIIDKSRTANDKMCGISLEEYEKPYILVADGRTYNYDSIIKAITSTLMNDESLRLQDTTLTYHDVNKGKVVLYPNLSLWSNKCIKEYTIIEYKSTDIKFQRFNHNRLTVADRLSILLCNDTGDDGLWDYEDFVRTYKTYYEPDATFRPNEAIIKNIVINTAPIFTQHGKSGKGSAIFQNVHFIGCCIKGCLCGVHFISCRFEKCVFVLKDLMHFNSKNCDYIECEYMLKSKDESIIRIFNDVNEFLDKDLGTRIFGDRPEIKNCKLILSKIL